jgi:SAM-dependent methyltransferase
MLTQNPIPSSSPEFWDVRYAAEQVPWDHGRAPETLETFLALHPGPGKALIPGCGFGYEIRAFSSTGWDAIGIDFSPVAVRCARMLLGPLADKVHEGDFFTYPFDEGGFDVVYERAFLCALPSGILHRYAKRMAQLVTPGGLLCGFFFFGPEDEPPPYPISQHQLDGLLGGRFEKVEDRGVPVSESSTLYAGKERWQVWTRKSSPPAGHFRLAP